MSELKWIKHYGGTMPVPDDTIVAWMMRGGEIALSGSPAKHLEWGECGDGTITEYAIVTPSQSEEVTRALDVQEGGNHYKTLSIQPVEYMIANNIPFAEGCVIKYVTRWRAKGRVEDLRKARHFIDLLIEYEADNGQV